MSSPVPISASQRTKDIQDGERMCLQSLSDAGTPKGKGCARENPRGLISLGNVHLFLTWYTQQLYHAYFFPQMRLGHTRNKSNIASNRSIGLKIFELKRHKKTHKKEPIEKEEGKLGQTQTR